MPIDDEYDEALQEAFDTGVSVQRAAGQILLARLRKAEVTLQLAEERHHRALEERYAQGFKEGERFGRLGHRAWLVEEAG